MGGIRYLVTFVIEYVNSQVTLVAVDVVSGTLDLPGQLRRCTAAQIPDDKLLAFASYKVINYLLTKINFEL